MAACGSSPETFISTMVVAPSFPSILMRLTCFSGSLDAMICLVATDALEDDLAGLALRLLARLAVRRNDLRRLLRIAEHPDAVRESPASSAAPSWKADRYMGTRRLGSK